MAETHIGVATMPAAIIPAAEPGPAEFLKLLTFLSPAFPVGSFAYSHGLEWPIDSGAVGAADRVAEWICALLEIGGGWNDAVLLAAAYRAAGGGDRAELRAVAELAEALAGSRERHVETIAQGRAFLDAVAAGWGRPALLDGLAGAAYPVAVAVVGATHGIALRSVLPAYLNGFAANLVSVAVRLIPLGQEAGLKILARLHTVVAEVAERAVASRLDDLGAATVLGDIASMRHETQYSRVFRT